VSAGSSPPRFPQSPPSGWSDGFALFYGTLYVTVTNHTCGTVHDDDDVIFVRRGSAAIWKSGRRPAWTSAACAAVTVRRVPRIYTVGAKWAPVVRCRAAEVSPYDFSGVLRIYIYKRTWRTFVDFIKSKRGRRVINNDRNNFPVSGVRSNIYIYIVHGRDDGSRSCLGSF